MSTEDVVVRPDAEAVAGTVALHLLDRLAEAEADAREPHVVLTGGSISRRVHARLAELADERDDIDWSKVSVWWGDERYVASDDEDRNAGQALADGLQHLPLTPARVHAMPATDDGYEDVATAAAAYADALEAARGLEPESHPWFDVLMLGIGPDGHCASLFPGRPEVHETALALAVRDSPKPPPTRISLGMPVLGRAREVWFVAAGADKADAVARSVEGGDVAQTPAAGPRGRVHTVWYLDEDAAARVRG
jgi:6-phosphogluconolactonase